jgi:AcrR family transcriptional regulator
MSSAEQNPSRGEATRQAILNAAEQLILAQGYNGTSMRQIAEGAGEIAVSGIYNHYKSKEDIFRALLEARSPYPKVIEILDSTQEGTGPEMMAAAFRAMSNLMRQHYDFIRLVAIDIQEHNADTIVSLISILLPHALQFFGRAQAAGHIRQDIPVFVLARTFISLLFGYNLTSFVLFDGDLPRLPVPIPLDNVDWLSATIDIFINGIATGTDSASDQG